MKGVKSEDECKVKVKVKGKGKGKDKAEGKGEGEGGSERWGERRGPGGVAANKLCACLLLLSCCSSCRGLTEASLLDHSGTPQVHPPRTCTRNGAGSLEGPNQPGRGRGGERGGGGLRPRRARNRVR